MSKIFEEAIADAKKLKEVAEKNAKDAIIESLTPKIRNYIEQEIISQNKEESITGIDGGENFQKLFEMLGIKDQTSLYANKAFQNLSENNQSQIKNLLKKINQNINTLENNEINNKVNNFKEHNMEKFYEVDLKALRESVEKESDDLSAMEELKDDMNEMYEEDSIDEMYEMENMYDEDSLDDDMLSEQDDFVDLEGDEEPSEEEPSEEMEMTGGDSISKSEVEAQIQELISDLGLEIGGAAAAADDMDLDMEEPSEEDSEKEPLDEVFDIDPRMLREELANIRRSMQESKSMDHHFGGSGEGKAGVSAAFGGKGPKKLGHEKSFGGGSYGKDVFVNPPSTLKKLNEAKRMLQKLSRMNRSQNEKLNKYRSAVQTLREQLEELNLFNAKLLYVNKLLQNDNINESQKKSVIKALDEAKSLTEAKTLFKSLTETFQSKKGSLNESARFGSSSRTTPSASASSTKPVGEMDRWQKLAGLK